MVSRPPHVRVLYIEDNADDALLYKRLLSEDGLSVEPSRSLEEAERLLKRTGPFHAVLLELRLASMSGVQTLRAVRKLTDLPVVVLSGLQDSQTVLEAVRAGARDYFVKGRADKRALQTAIRNSVEWWQMCGLVADSPD